MHQKLGALILVKSWDCFDTLIARRFVKPGSIWDEISLRKKDPGFYNRRKQAFKDSGKVFDKTYEILGLHLKDLELEIELEHCYPIIENIKQVEEGDYIISDMYLSEEFIMKMLRKCGLTKNVNLIVTPLDKHNGIIWPKLNPKPSLHTGDNEHSDYVQPRRHDIQSSHYRNSELNSVEKEVYETNVQLASFMRFLRLQCPYDSQSVKRSIWEDQTNYNIPILILGALELPKQKIHFVHRDSVFLQPIFEILTGITCERFDCSRVVLLNSNEHFDSYFDNLNPTMIVDLHGTGRSLDYYFNSRNISKIKAIYLLGHQIDDLKADITHILDDGTSFIAIEKYNISNLGTITDWNENGPIRIEPEHPNHIISIMNEVNKICIQEIRNFNISKPNRQLMKKLTLSMKQNKTKTNQSIYLQKHHIDSSFYKK